MYQRLEDVACIVNFIGSVIFNFIKLEKVGAIHKLKISFCA